MRHHFQKRSAKVRRKVRPKVTKPSFWILETMGPIKHPTIILVFFSTMQNLSSYGNLKKRIQPAGSFSKTFVENRRKVRRKVTKPSFWGLETMGPIQHPTISLFNYATRQNLSSHGWFLDFFLSEKRLTFLFAKHSGFLVFQTFSWKARKPDCFAKKNQTFFKQENKKKSKNQPWELRFCRVA